MELVTLLANSKRLKQIIREFGDEWWSLPPEPKICFNDELGRFIVSKDGKSHKRNVRIIDVKLP